MFVNTLNISFLIKYIDHYWGKILNPISVNNGIEEQTYWSTSYVYMYTLNNDCYPAPIFFLFSLFLKFFIFFNYSFSISLSFFLSFCRSQAFSISFHFTHCFLFINSYLLFFLFPFIDLFLYFPFFFFLSFFSQSLSPIFIFSLFIHIFQFFFISSRFFPVVYISFFRILSFNIF